MDLLKIGLVSDKVDAYTLRDTADWIIKPRLLAVPGVAHVIVFGGDVRQIQIQPDMRKLSSFGLTFTDVADAAKAALPLRGAGFIDLPAQRVLLQSPTPEPDTEALGQAVVAVRNDTPILLRDVADVEDGARVALRRCARSWASPACCCRWRASTAPTRCSTTLAVEKALADCARR